MSDLGQAERDALIGLLTRNGFRRCDMSACNCGSWHQVDGWPKRFREIDEVTENDWRNGETLLARVKRICAERDAAVKLLCELVDIEGPQPGTAVWADKVLQFLSIALEVEP